MLLRNLQLQQEHRSLIFFYAVPVSYVFNIFFFALFSKAVSTSTAIFNADKNYHINPSNIFDQARNFSERVNIKKNVKKYVSDSDTDSDSDIEKRKRVNFILSFRIAIF